jgi:hypothetical protein
VPDTISVADDFPLQQERVRAVLSMYEEVAKSPGGAGCAFVIAMTKAALARADRAAISGDIVAIVEAYRELKDIE